MALSFRARAPHPVADAGSAFPVTLVRVFNDAGAAGTTGLALEPMAASDALQNGETGVLITPADTRFRLNIGVRTLAQGVAMNLTYANAAYVTPPPGFSSSAPAVVALPGTWRRVTSP